MATKERFEQSIESSEESTEIVEQTKEIKQSICTSQSEPIPGTSGQFKLTLRKDLFDEIPPTAQKPILEK